MDTRPAAAYTTIPPVLKDLIRKTVRIFYPPECILFIDLLVINGTLKFTDLVDVSQLDEKSAKAAIASLERDKLVKKVQLDDPAIVEANKKRLDEYNKQVQEAKLRGVRFDTPRPQSMRAGAECYYIDYKTFVNMLKYRLHKMQSNVEHNTKKSAKVNTYMCSNMDCGERFTDFQFSDLFNPTYNKFMCSQCDSEIKVTSTQTEATPSSFTVAKLNLTLKGLREVLIKTDNIVLSQAVVQHAPLAINVVDKINNATNRARQQKDTSAAQKQKFEKNVTYADFVTEKATVEVKFEEAYTGPVKAREQPEWFGSSSVAIGGAAASSFSNGDSGEDRAVTGVKRPLEDEENLIVVEDEEDKGDARKAPEESGMEATTAQGEEEMMVDAAGEGMMMDAEEEEMMDATEEEDAGAMREKLRSTLISVGSEKKMYKDVTDDDLMLLTEEQMDLYEHVHRSLGSL